MNEGHCSDDLDEDDTVSYKKYQKLPKNQRKTVKQSLFTVYNQLQNIFFINLTF